MPVMDWIVLILLCLPVLCRPVRSAVTVRQSSRVDSTDGTIQLQCVIHPQPSFLLNPTPHWLQDVRRYPYPTPQVLQVSLLKGLHGNQELCSNMLNASELTAVRQGRGLGEVQCSAHMTEGAIEVTVEGLKATQTDIYRCEIKVFFPPPFLRFMGNGTLVHVRDHCIQKETQKQALPQQLEEEEVQTVQPITAPVAILLILIAAVILGIGYLQAIQCSQRKHLLTINY